MSFTNKKISAVYKDILHTDNSNTGISSTIKQIKCGDGDASALYLSNRNLKVQPSTDSTTNSVIYDADGNALVTVDSTNDLVKAGVGQHIVNTQYAYFGVMGGDAGWGLLSANTHYAVPFNNTTTTSGVIANLGLGTSTDPATSLTISDSAMDIVQCYWYVPDNIYVEKVLWWSAGDAATGDTTRAHLMAYDVVTTAGGTSGDLSNGYVVAASSDVTSAGYEQAYYNEMTVSVPAIPSGKVALFTFRAASVNSDYTINATIKYYLY